jgi:hypothetical protein
MPLTEKGEKIMSSMKAKYGSKKGEEVFYASKNAGKITGVDDDDRVPLEEGKSRETINKNVAKLVGAGHKKETAYEIAERKSRMSKSDDNQHMGFSTGLAEPIEELVKKTDALLSRVDAFVERRKQQRQPVDVKPRTKDNMQPSDPHPKEVG